MIARTGAVNGDRETGINAFTETLFDDALAAARARRTCTPVRRGRAGSRPRCWACRSRPRRSTRSPGGGSSRGWPPTAAGSPPPTTRWWNGSRRPAGSSTPAPPPPNSAAPPSRTPRCGGSPGTRGTWTARPAVPPAAPAPRWPRALPRWPPPPTLPAPPASPPDSPAPSATRRPTGGSPGCRRSPRTGTAATGRWAAPLPTPRCWPPSCPAATRRTTARGEAERDKPAGRRIRRGAAHRAVRHARRLPGGPRGRGNTLAVARALEAPAPPSSRSTLPWTTARITETIFAHFGHILGPAMAAETAGTEDRLAAYTRRFMADAAAAAAEHAGGVPRHGRPAAGGTRRRHGRPRRAAVPDLRRRLARRGRGLPRRDRRRRAPPGPLLGGAHDQPFNVANRCPVLAVPSGISADGVPTGVQVVGHPFAEAMAFRVGAAVESLVPRPPGRRPLGRCSAAPEPQGQKP